MEVIVTASAAALTPARACPTLTHPTGWALALFPGKLSLSLRATCPGSSSIPPGSSADPFTQPFRAKPPLGDGQRGADPSVLGCLAELNADFSALPAKKSPGSQEDQQA